MKFSLAHKIIFVVAVPVLFQLGFIAFMSSALARLADRQVVAQKTANTLLARDRIYMCENQRMLFYGMYRATQKPIYREKFFAIEHQIDRVFSELSKIWAAEPKKRAALKSTYRGVQGTGLVAQQMMQGDKQSHISELLGGPQGVYFLRLLLRREAATNFEKVFHDDEEVQRVNNLIMQRSQSDIRHALLLGLILSLIICLACGLIFSLSISNRLRKVLRNITSMEERNPDLLIVGGSDEIFTLNRAIEFTSKKIMDAEAFQAQTIRIVADELDDPLQSISNSLVELRDTGFQIPSAKATERLTDSVSETSRLRSLVTDLAGLHKLETASYTLEIKEMDLLEAAQEAIKSVKELAQSRHVTLSLKTTESVLVSGDAERIIQVAVNLLSNAVKFSPENSVVEVSVTLRESQGRISVRDHGPGIPTEFRNRIFKRFEQSEDDSAKPNSSGLGLAICKELIESQHGTMGFSTKIGEGSTFWMALPLHTQTALNNQSESVTKEPDGQRQKWHSTLWKKALAVVVLPLLLQVVTVVALWSALNTIGANIDEFTRANRIANIHAEMLDHISRSTFYAMLYNVDKDPETKAGVAREENKLSELMTELDTFAARSHALSATTGIQRQAIAKHFSLHQELMNAEQDASPERWFGPKNEAATEELLVQTQKPLMESLESEWNSMIERTESAEKDRRGAEFVLISAAGISGLLSAILGVFMVSILTRRVKVLLSHMGTFAQKKQLVEPILGSDELAFVDRRFHASARKLLELERFKNEMIALTSHELRTPLASISALTEVIDARIFGELTESGKAALASAQSTIVELIAMITDLLDLEKMQSGKILVTLRSINVDDILTAAVSNAEQLAHQNEIDVRIRLSGLTAEADMQRITQALTAVLRDLLKKLPGSSTVWLTSERSNNGIDFSIKMPWADEDDIDAVQATAGERLALDLSKLIAEQHGGRLIISRLHNARLITMSLPATVPVS